MDISVIIFGKFAFVVFGVEIDVSLLSLQLDANAICFRQCRI